MPNKPSNQAISGGEGGIRTLGPPQEGQRFSRPPRSTAPAPLRSSGVNNLDLYRHKHQENSCRIWTRAWTQKPFFERLQGQGVTSVEQVPIDPERNRRSSMT